jgi:hypothetical protein
MGTGLIRSLVVQSRIWQSTISVCRFSRTGLPVNSVSRRCAVAYAADRLNPAGWRHLFRGLPAEWNGLAGEGRVEFGHDPEEVAAMLDAIPDLSDTLATASPQKLAEISRRST